MDNDSVQLLRSVIREELAPVNDHLERTDKKLDGVSQHLEKIDQRIELIEEEQHLIKSAVLETNERLINIESLLENQHRIIELLSARSIEQEAKLKRIK
ncbi:hypothetical protein J7E73_26225 [Paenibacillus albidus]|uniref:hypothetical protein n=1 Tax=Paenibacillus albidus TaxID=2041023 RepID=UPI001BE62982|nr:hypothetical protein [Paenibacillus albidus]MBT2292569.1 hypothetical protein [Paenibacillus albidus]